MISKTEIANIALAKFREGRITSIESTTDSVSVIMADHYDHALNLVLSEHRWNFASKRKTLSRLGSDPIFGWDYQYQLPTDLLRIKDVNGEDHEASSQLHEIEGTALLTNDTTMDITYIAIVTDTNLFSPAFVDALACKLASLTCARITGDDQLALALGKTYEFALAKAILNDSKTNGSRDKNLMRRTMESSDILNVRGSRYNWAAAATRASTSTSTPSGITQGSDEW